MLELPAVGAIDGIAECLRGRFCINIQRALVELTPVVAQFIRKTYLRKQQMSIHLCDYPLLQIGMRQTAMRLTPEIKSSRGHDLPGKRRAR